MSDIVMKPMELGLKTTVEERRLEYGEQLAEKEYQLSRLEAEEKRFREGTLKRIERDKIRLKREIAELTRQRDGLDDHKEAEIIDVINVTSEGGVNE